jgi:hypothetical protein
MKMNMSPARIGYRPARQNAHPAIAANTRLAIDTWFGVMRAEASDRAMACGHPALRVRSSRRAGGGDTSSDVGGMRDSVIRMRRTPLHPSVPPRRGVFLDRRTEDGWTD